MKFKPEDFFVGLPSGFGSEGLREAVAKEAQAKFDAWWKEHSRLITEYYSPKFKQWKYEVLIEEGDKYAED